MDCECSKEYSHLPNKRTPFDWLDLTSVIILIQCARSSMSRVDVIRSTAFLPALLSPIAEFHTLRTWNSAACQIPA